MLLILLLCIHNTVCHDTVHVYSAFLSGLLSCSLKTNVLLRAGMGSYGWDLYETAGIAVREACSLQEVTGRLHARTANQLRRGKEQGRVLARKAEAATMAAERAVQDLLRSAGSHIVTSSSKQAETPRLLCRRHLALLSCRYVAY